MRLLLGVAIITCWCLPAQTRGSVGDLVALVRRDLQLHRSDGHVAKDVRKIRLGERLDERTVEVLESEGAGPETVEELTSLVDRSSKLPRPAAPTIAEPPPPSPTEQVHVWDAAHDNALSYTESLPDFICTEIVRRYLDPKTKGDWKLQDTLALRLTYFDRREQYKLVTVNNRPTSRSYEEMRGAITEGEFGSMLSAIFALKSRTNRQWDHWTTLRSRPTYVYTFAIAARNSDYIITSGSSLRDEARIRVAQHGYVYIDAATKMVVRLKAIADDFPANFDVRKVVLTLDYDFTEVGGTRYLLPLHSETVLWAPPIQHRNQTDFLNYRKFTADTSITYDGTIKK